MPFPTLSFTGHFGRKEKEAADPAPWRGGPEAAGTDPSLTESGAGSNACVMLCDAANDTACSFTPNTKADVQSIRIPGETLPLLEGPEGQWRDRDPVVLSLG